MEVAQDILQPKITKELKSGAMKVIKGQPLPPISNIMPKQGVQMASFFENLFQTVSPNQSTEENKDTRGNITKAEMAKAMALQSGNFEKFE